MARIYTISDKALRKRTELIWSLSEEGFDGQEIADIFNMEKSWMGRIIKKKPKDFKSVFIPVVK